MTPDPKFKIGETDPVFWAHVRSLSECLGYSTRRKRSASAVAGTTVPTENLEPTEDEPEQTDEEILAAEAALTAAQKKVAAAARLARKLEGKVATYTFEDILKGMDKLGLFTEHLCADGKPTALADKLVEYFNFRAKKLNDEVFSNLMTLAEAKKTYEDLKAELGTSRLPETVNKQKGDMKTVSFLTAMVNRLVEAYSAGIDFAHNPMQLTTVTVDSVPVRTLARRVDGAFPAIINPVAVWEIKEYYHTLTFGSRVAGGVYETLLDGMELQELQQTEDIGVEHLLIVDSRNCWWADGRPYLCRMVDSLHMGYVDEILFGKEVLERLPELVPEWVKKSKAQKIHRKPIPKPMPVKVKRTK